MLKNDVVDFHLEANILHFLFHPCNLCSGSLNGSKTGKTDSVDKGDWDQRHNYLADLIAIKSVITLEGEYEADQVGD